MRPRYAVKVIGAKADMLCQQFGGWAVFQNSRSGDRRKQSSSACSTCNAWFGLQRLHGRITLPFPGIFAGHVKLYVFRFR